MVSSIREEIYGLSIKVDHMQTELHVLRIDMHHSLKHLRGRVETGFTEILAAIQCLAPITAPIGPFDPPPNSPP